MVRVNPEIETSAIIKVIGVGGSGKNAVNHMIKCGVEGVEYICMNADSQDLKSSNASKKVVIGKNRTEGKGTGMDPEIGREAAEETKSEIQEALKGADVVFIACGLGGGTGSGASPIIARIAKEQGSLTVAVVTKPFAFEGQARRVIANRAVDTLKKEVDAIILVSNDQLLALGDDEISFEEGFQMADDILKNTVQKISYMITTPGKINVDFTDIKTILQNTGTAFIGHGVASGENRAEEAAFNAINSPLLDMAVTGAKNILFSITGAPDDLKMTEVNRAAQIITEQADTDARIIWGHFNDDNLQRGEVLITVVAAGFETTTKPDPNPMRSVSSSSSPNESTSRPITMQSNDDVFEEESDDDDDWSSLPAILRKRKSSE